MNFPWSGLYGAPQRVCAFGHFWTFAHVIRSPESRHSTVIGGTLPYFDSITPSAYHYVESQYQRLATKFQGNMWIFGCVIGGNMPCYKTAYVRLIIFRHQVDTPMEMVSVTFQGPKIDDLPLHSQLPSNLGGLLSSLNGFIQFGGGLHVRGACLSPAWHSLRPTWRGDYALHTLYEAVNETDIPFAQDCVGDQFLYRDGTIHRLQAESGEIETLDVDLASFFESVNSDPVEFLGMEPLLRFQQDGNTLQPGELIHVYPPFCTKESASGVSLRAVPAAELIRAHADFARQFGPDGSTVAVKVVD